MRTISFVNLKGGVGKTTSVINVAAVLAAEYGANVLVIDADSQGNTSKSLLPPGEYNTLDLILDGTEEFYEHVVYPSSVRNLDVIPGDISLMDADLASLTGGRTNINALRDLRDAITEDDAYDYILIDCPPSFSAACAAAIAASDSIVIPIKLDMFSVSGMKELTAQIEGVHRIHPDVRVAGCLVTMWYRDDVVLQGERFLREHAPVHVFKTMIRRTPKVDESTWAHEPVITWSPRSAAAQDYRKFVAELVGGEVRRYGQV